MTNVLTFPDSPDGEGNQDDAPYVAPAPTIDPHRLTYTERYSDELPAESVEFECRDNADYVGKLGEAASVPGGEDLPIL